MTRKRKNDAVEKTRKKFVDDQAKLGEAMAKIVKETAELKEVKNMKRNEAAVILKILIAKISVELDNLLKKPKELERKTSEVDARGKQLDTLHADIIRKLEDQNATLKL